MIKKERKPLTEEQKKIACERAKLYQKLNKERVNKSHKEWRELNKEKTNLYQLKYREENPDKVKNSSDKYRKNNPKKIKENNAKWNKNNPDKRNSISAKYRKNNPEKIKNSILKYNKANPTKIKITHQKYKKNRLQNDMLYKLYHNTGSSIRTALKNNGFTKKSRSYKTLGCSFEEFKSYLESKFESWMTWENRGLYNGELNYGWDIDHIIPTSSAKIEEELLKLCNFNNLQPLCSKTNRDIKKAKF